MMASQSSAVKGARSEEIGVAFSLLCGFFITMPIPVCMKGFVKSTTLSRMYEMVSGATAISASWKKMTPIREVYTRELQPWGSYHAIT